MKEQYEILNNVISELEKNVEDIDSEDLDAMFNLRKRIKEEGTSVDRELFRYAVEPLIRRYNLSIDTVVLQEY